MNEMMSLVPGANDTPPFTHQDLKNIYFKKMPVEGQHAFINNGQDIASHNYTLLNLQQYMGTQETLCRALTQACHSHHNQSRNQNQNKNTSNNCCRIEENNNGPYRQHFRLENSHNGNPRHFQRHPYYCNPTTNNNQATSNSRGQQPERNRHTGHTHLPPSVPPHSILTSTPELAECLLEHPVFDDDGNLPFCFATIQEYQQQDHNVTKLATTQPDKYMTKHLGGHEIITL